MVRCLAYGRDISGPSFCLLTPSPPPPTDYVALPMSYRIIRAQTSSLNVTAGDYNNPLSRAPVDLLPLEPSPAPRRRGLLSSTNATSAPGRGGGGGGKRGMDVPSLSSSLMQASMSSSSASLLASSPPRSRAGALARAPTARDSLSSSRDAFQRAPVSLLQLDIGYSPEYVEAMPGAVPGAVHIPSTGDSGMPGIVPHSRSDSSSSPPMTKSEVEVEIGSVQGGAAGGIQGLPMDETKFGGNRRDMMSRLQVQQSFKADAPVSLEQVRGLFWFCSVRYCAVNWFRAPSSAMAFFLIF